MLKPAPAGQRARRMPLKADVLLLCEGQAWSCSAIDLSASGISMERPDDIQVEVGDTARVEVLLSGNRTMPLAGRVSRLDAGLVGISFTSIPVGSEASLWGLLGEYADWAEAPED